MSQPPAASPADEQLNTEQQIVTELYRRLDTLRTTAANDLAGIRQEKATGTHQGRSERDAYATLYEDRLAQLWAVEERLVFGRLDLANADHRYIGRIGIGDEHDDTRLLVDWRAPAATSFYQATAAVPLGVARRRHLALTGRDVTAIEDDVLDLAATKKLGLTDLRGEGALMAAVTSARTGRMGDIVATIQAEQDQIIRDDLAGVLVVQGGPGTGKTAVALHRAAYLLYTHRERLAKSGVLILGPSRGFMRYIDQVLPSLGETGVVMMTTGELYPPVTATENDSGTTAVVKGDLRMAAVLANAVGRYHAPVTEDRTFHHMGVTLKLTKRAINNARTEALKTGKPHNEARTVFLKHILQHLVDVYTRVASVTLESTERNELIYDLRQEKHVMVELNRLWLPLSPELVLNGLFALPYRLDTAAPQLTETEKHALWRDPDQPFTIDDVPLLDELAHLIGDLTDSSGTTSGQPGSDLSFAEQVIENTDVGGYVTAAQLAERFRDGGPVLTVAERALADREWAYGHAVIDEAQELSPMMWRAVLRRVPTKSLTAVGDVAQTRADAGANTWGHALDPHIGDRFRVRTLSVNYRTPGRIMAIAHRFAHAHNLPVDDITTVRVGDFEPQFTAAKHLLPAVRSIVPEELAAIGTGRLAVVVPTEQIESVAAALRTTLATDIGVGATAVDHRVCVVAPVQTKGLEFDGVVMAEPATLMAATARGAGDVFVVLTRATQRLHVVHTQELPHGLIPNS